ERAVRARGGGGDHHDVAGAALLDGCVDHQVVARPAQHGDGRAADARALLDRPQVGAEVAGAAERLVHGGDAELGERVDVGEVGARRVGDDDRLHASTPVTCGYSRTYASPIVLWGSPRFGPALRFSCTPRRLARSV